MASLRTVVVALALHLSIAAPSFEEFTEIFGKKYTLAERVERKAIYEARVVEITAKNAAAGNTAEFGELRSRFVQRVVHTLRRRSCNPQT